MNITKKLMCLVSTNKSQEKRSSVGAPRLRAPPLVAPPLDSLTTDNTLSLVHDLNSVICFWNHISCTLHCVYI